MLGSVSVSFLNSFSGMCSRKSVFSSISWEFFRWLTSLGVCVVLFEGDGFYVAKDDLEFMILLLFLPKHCVVFPKHTQTQIQQTRTPPPTFLF